MTSVQAFAAAYALAATISAIGLVVALHVLEPEFDPSWRMLSEYSLGRYGVLMRAAFIAAGTGVVGCAIALSGAAWPASLALAVVAIGPLGAAFVDTDPVTTPRAEFSRRGKVHAAFGSVFILGFPFAATSVGISAAGDPAIGPILAWASLVPWITLAWFIWATIRNATPDGRGTPMSASAGRTA
jgi:hypothetical protein